MEAEKAEAKLSKAFKERTKSRLRNVRMKMQKAKGVQLADEDVDFSSEIEAAGIHWKEKLARLMETDITVFSTRKESYDFFVKTDWKDDKENEGDEEDGKTKFRQKLEQVLQIQDDPTANEYDRQLFLLERLATSIKQELLPTERSQTKFKSRGDRAYDERKYLYYPSSEPVIIPPTLEQGNEEEAESQTVNEEQSKNLNKLKQRLQMEGSFKKWVDERGNFKYASTDDTLKGVIIVIGYPDAENEKEVAHSLLRRQQAVKYANLQTKKHDEENPEAIEEDQSETAISRLMLCKNNTDEEECEKLLKLASDEEVANNLRYCLLQLRAKGDSRYKNFRFVPLIEKDLLNMLEESKESKQRQVAHLKAKSNNGSDFQQQQLTIEKRREKVATKLRKALQRVQQQSPVIDKPKKTLEDLVVEEEASTR